MPAKITVKYQLEATVHHYSSPTWSQSVGHTAVSFKVKDAPGNEAYTEPYFSFIGGASVTQTEKGDQHGYSTVAIPAKPTPDGNQRTVTLSQEVKIKVDEINLIIGSKRPDEAIKGSYELIKEGNEWRLFSVSSHTSKPSKSIKDGMESKVKQDKLVRYPIAIQYVGGLKEALEKLPPGTTPEDLLNNNKKGMKKATAAMKRAITHYKVHSDAAHTLPQTLNTEFNKYIKIQSYQERYYSHSSYNVVLRNCADATNFMLKTAKFTPNGEALSGIVTPARVEALAYRLKFKEIERKRKAIQADKKTSDSDKVKALLENDIEKLQTEIGKLKAEMIDEKNSRFRLIPLSIKVGRIEKKIESKKREITAKKIKIIAKEREIILKSDTHSPQKINLVVRDLIDNDIKKLEIEMAEHGKKECALLVELRSLLDKKSEVGVKEFVGIAQLIVGGFDPDAEFPKKTKKEFSPEIRKNLYDYLKLISLDHVKELERPIETSKAIPTPPTIRGTQIPPVVPKSSSNMREAQSTISTPGVDFLAGDFAGRLKKYPNIHLQNGSKNANGSYQLDIFANANERSKKLGHLTVEKNRITSDTQGDKVYKAMAALVADTFGGTLKDASITIWASTSEGLLALSKVCEETFSAKRANITMKLGDEKGEIKSHDELVKPVDKNSPRNA